MFVRKTTFLFIVSIGLSLSHAMELGNETSLIELPMELLNYIQTMMMPTLSAPAGQILENLDDALSYATSSRELLRLKGSIIGHLQKNQSHYLSVRNFHGDNLLQIAIKECKWQLAELLIIAYFAPESLDSSSRDHLFTWAIGNGHKKLAKQLIVGAFAKNPSVDAIEYSVSLNDVPEFRRMANLKSTQSGKTLLHFAVENKREKCAGILLKNGASVNDRCGGGYMPIHVAAKKGLLGFVELLVRNGSDVNSRGDEGITPLILAALYGHVGVIKFLLAHGADVNATTDFGLTALAAAKFACDGLQASDEIMKLLLDQAADLTASDNLNKNSALRFAVEKNFLSMASWLLKDGADSNTKFSGANLLHSALFFDRNGSHLQMVELLLENKANVNAQNDKGETPLICSFQLDTNVEMQKLLLQYNPDINTQDLSGCTALINYVQFTWIDNSHPDLMARGIDQTKLLLDGGADINIAMNNGDTALHVAAMRNKLVLATLLLEHGADINAENCDGLTALKVAVKHGHKEMIKLLLGFKADVNSTSGNGLTPLMMAACNKEVDIIAILFEAGANPHLVNADNKTALDMAHELVKSNKKFLIVNYLDTVVWRGRFLRKFKEI